MGPGDDPEEQLFVRVCAKYGKIPAVVKREFLARACPAKFGGMDVGTPFRKTMTIPLLNKLIELATEKLWSDRIDERLDTKEVLIAHMLAIHERLGRPLDRLSVDESTDAKNLSIAIDGRYELIGEDGSVVADGQALRGIRHAPSSLEVQLPKQFGEQFGEDAHIVINDNFGNRSAFLTIPSKPFVKINVQDIFKAAGAAEILKVPEDIFHAQLN